MERRIRTGLVPMNSETRTKLDDKELRNFGLSTGGIIGVLFGLAIPWLWNLNYPYWPWVVFLILGLSGLAAPRILRPVHHGWMKVGLAISKVTTPILMGVVFFLVVMPIGLVKRIFGRDPMDREFDQAAKSYRIVAENNAEGASEKPY